MKAVACIVQCECGGHIHSLLEDGVYYMVTEADTIIFQGKCNTCHENVRVERPIISFFGMAKPDRMAH